MRMPSILPNKLTEEPRPLYEDIKSGFNTKFSEFKAGKIFYSYEVEFT